MEVKPVKCKKCGAKPIVKKIDDCYYAQCTGCTKWQAYQFLGATVNGAIRNWNVYNSTTYVKEDITL